LPPLVSPPEVAETPTVAPEVTQPTEPPVPQPMVGGRRLIRVAGRTMSATTALGAFGCWQLLALSGATLYALVERRRRLLDGGGT
jgi:hypothetical protein